jgi:tetratricopeptide (TPR) repeat protein
LAERVDDQFWQPQHLSLLGRIHHLMGQWDEARADFGQACQVWREREAWLDLSSTLLNWARLEQDAGQANRARQLCTEAASLANKHEAANLMEQVSALLLELPPTTELEECDEHKR